jgi:hypothetical protein
MLSMMAGPIAVSFVGGGDGQWLIDRIHPERGQALPPAPWLSVLEGGRGLVPGAVWTLRGTTSNERYTTAAEHAALISGQPALGRPSATRAALIPVTKSSGWWDLSQDQRRSIFEERSRHIATGLRYLPAIARRLYHGRDLGEPFDFLTWFEYSPGDAAAFDELVGRLRATEEWSFVTREIDIRLTKRTPL